MNRRVAFVFFLGLFSGGASADTVWKGTSVNSITSGTGDILETQGGALSVSAESTGTENFVGADRKSVV